MNKVTSGKYSGKYLDGEGNIILNWKSRYNLNNKTVTKFELLNTETNKSGSSAVGRGIVGGALLGPVGLLGGALSAKNKSTHLVRIYHNDGLSSVLELDNKMYNKLMINLG